MEADKSDEPVWNREKVDRGFCWLFADFRLDWYSVLGSGRIPVRRKQVTRCDEEQIQSPCNSFYELITTTCSRRGPFSYNAMGKLSHSQEFTVGCLLNNHGDGMVGRNYR